MIIDFLTIPLYSLEPCSVEDANTTVAYPINGPLFKLKAMQSISEIPLKTQKKPWEHLNRSVYKGGKK